MADLNQPTREEHILEEPRKLPDMLNVLTILTFIGSGLGLISAFWTFAKARASYEALSSANLDQLPDWAKRMSGGDPVETARKALDNRVPILILTLVGCALCIYGAMEMRKLKKTGFTVYIIGELLPVISAIIFFGNAATGIAAIIGYFIYVLFIILYATQLKYLK
ncbi:MAG TPA: hypothetical protein VGS79_14060 [Puia sp.]|nr:hypothetical protein [Puia sp.]